MMLRKIYSPTDSVGGGDDHLVIKDARKKDAASGVQISDKNRKNAKVNPSLVKNIIREAKFQGVDPYTALAIAYQESDIGEIETFDNPFQLLDTRLEDKDLVKKGVSFLKEKINYGKKLGKKTEEEILQAYNGYGKIKPYRRTTNGPLLDRKMYGIDVTNGLDMSKNPVYGKRIIDLRDNVLKAHPEIVKLVDSEQGNDPNLNAPYKQPDNYKPLSVEEKTDWNKFLDYVNNQRGF